MGLETGTYINSLNAANPVGGVDKVLDGDNHIRLLKSTILATFPNVTGAMTSSQGELNILDGADVGGIAAGLLAATSKGAQRTYLDCPELSGANAFGGVNTFTDDPIISSSDAGATVGPNLTLFRNSASPAASDILGRLKFDGKDSAGNTETYASIEAQILDPSSGGEDAQIVIKGRVGTAEGNFLTIGSNGAFVGSAAGGGQGNNTLNASALYQSSIRLPAFGRQANVTADRAIGTTYRNLAGYPIFVSVCLAMNNDGNSATAYTDGSSTPTTIAGQAAGDTTTNRVTFPFWVIQGDYFRIVAATASLQLWSEST